MKSILHGDGKVKEEGRFGDGSGGRYFFLVEKEEK